MEQLTGDINSVAVYMDGLLVRWKDAEDWLNDLRRLLKSFNQKIFLGEMEKCNFAHPQVKCFVHRFSMEKTAKSAKVDAVLHMSKPTDVSGIR